MVRRGTAQVVLVVKTTQSSAINNEVICIAGDFNAWNPAKDTFHLVGKGIYQIALPLKTGSYAYKFTKGSWLSVEGNEDGGVLQNRTMEVRTGIDTFANVIAGWEVQKQSKTHTALPNVVLLSDSFPLPQMGRKCRIWVCLPEDYQKERRKRYNTMYMLDGQNMFDRFYAYKDEWQIDETIHYLHQANKDPGCIVIGIDNGTNNRINELTPYANARHGGGEGRKMMEFIVKTLKPYIDTHYRTRPERNSTGIGGSSLGGLMSFYGAITYPSVFGRALVFSPSFWWNAQIYEDAENAQIPQKTKFTFLVGGNEEPSDEVVTKTNLMYHLLLKKGLDQNQCRYRYYPDGTHSEDFWAREFANSYLWLWSK